MLDGSDISLNSSLSKLARFAQYSGLNVNFDKTQVIWIGRKKYSSDTIKTKWKPVWGKGSFKLLGLNFHVDLDKMIDLNFNEKILALENKIKIWKRRYLSPLGKITVIKSLLIPKLTHLFISLPNPNTIILAQLNKIFFNFLWDGATKVKNTVIVKQYSEGGLKMINLIAFLNSLKLTWLRRLLKDNSTWKPLVDSKFNFNKLIIFGQSYCDAIICTLSNKFWRDVLMSYSKLQQAYVPEGNFDFLSSPLLHNNNITIGGVPITCQSWYKRGLFYVNDIIKENGSIYTLRELQINFNIKLNFFTIYRTN